jgi:hypothetical protein
LGSTGAASSSAKASKFTEIKEKLIMMKKFFDKKTQVLQEMNKLRITYNKLSNLVEVATTDDVVAEDIVRVSAELASLVDPSGVSDVVKIETHT